MKTLEQLQNEMDHLDMLFSIAADKGDIEAIENLTDAMLDLNCEIQSIVQPIKPLDFSCST